MTIRVGIMGAGWVAADRHAPSYARNKRCEVVAIYDPKASKAAELAKHFDVGLATDDLDRFYASGIDVVSICSSPWSHAELAITSMEQGCHVLTEKPMAMNSAEAAAMSETARRTGRILCVSHNFLFSRSVARADSALRRAGQIEYVLAMQFSSDQRRLPTWYQDLPGGLLFDEIPHLLYALQHYLGSLQLDSVRVSRRSEAGHPVLTEIQVTGENGPGQATVVSGAPISEWHVAVVAENGFVDLDFFRDIAVLIGPDGTHGARDILRTSSRVLREHAFGFVKSGVRLSTKRLFWGHDVLIGLFLDAVSDEAESPVALDDALAIVSLTDDILAAAAGP